MQAERKPKKSLTQAWRKSRLAARILQRQDQGTLSARDIRIGRALAHDPAVTSRLIQQALHGHALQKLRLRNTSRETA